MLVSMWKKQLRNRISVANRAVEPEGTAVFRGSRIEFRRERLNTGGEKLRGESFPDLEKPLVLLRHRLNGRFLKSTLYSLYIFYLHNASICSFLVLHMN
jgi:hypothetical protein